ncbi:MAG: hypothetical protein U1A78_38450 [Polyangia bacterium]
MSKASLPLCWSLRRRQAAQAAGLLVTLAFGCGAPEGDPSPPPPSGEVTPPGAVEATPPPGFIAASPQRPGDAKKGYDTLVNFGYVRCGVPYSLFAAYSLLFPTKEADKLPGRTGHNAQLPYYLSAFTNKQGVELVSPNCMVCHVSRMGGKLVVGLGETNSDYTSGLTSFGDLLSKLLSLGIGLKPAEKAELDRFLARSQAVGEFLVTRTRGTNPADNLGAVLAAHRDPVTLGWSDKPRMELPDKEPVPFDVPPWWRVRKKNALYYLGFGQGDHSRLMMAASMLCTDSTAEADEIDARFPDVRAYLAELGAPSYPFAIDKALADSGRGVFERTCSRCHGTYAPAVAGPSGALLRDRDQDRYPNRLIDIDEVRTDPMPIEEIETPRGRSYTAWLNESWFGKVSRIKPGHGYVAPPLDGIWATAPFLHNGSVPTLEALLDSSKRPRYFTRRFVPDDFDPVAVGVRVTPLDHGQLDEKDPQKRAALYDTTLRGYSNRGHTFGDALGADERKAVLEYLKTL